MGPLLTSPDPFLKFPLPVPHSASARNKRLPSPNPAATAQSFSSPTLLSPGSLDIPAHTPLLPDSQAGSAHVMKVSTLRDGSAMASPPPREMEEELAPAGSEPGTYGCRVEQVAGRRVGRAEVEFPFRIGG